MIIDETKYSWKKWKQPIFVDNNTWGSVSASSINKENYPYLALDGNDETQYEGSDSAPSVTFTWALPKPLKIYRFEFVNKSSGSNMITKDIKIYADDEKTELIANGTFEMIPKGKCDIELSIPVAVDKLVMVMTSVNRYVGLTSIRIVAEESSEKTILTPYLNTTDGMEFISSGYNDDTTFTTEGMQDIYFNKLVIDPVYISSNNWVGFGLSSDQLRICSRDGCSTAIYRQTGIAGNGVNFLKIRCEGYTAYKSQNETNRLIYELFILSTNDIFLNVIQTPTSSNIGDSRLTCNGIATMLEICDGSGGGKYVSFYHQDHEGLNWNIVYENYLEQNAYSSSFLICENSLYYSVLNGELSEVPIEVLSASMFLKYGFQDLPASELITALESPKLLYWKSGGKNTTVIADVIAYPHPQKLICNIDMSHESILGIKMFSAEYSGDVRVDYSYDNGSTFSDEISISEWLNSNPQDVWESLNDDKKMILRIVLYNDAKISGLKITYIN